MDEETCELIAKVGLGPSCPPEKVAFWTEVVQGTYRGDEGRKKARMAMLALLTRDGLLFRLSDVRCPVHWLQVRLFPCPCASETKHTQTHPYIPHWRRRKKHNGWLISCSYSSM